MYSDNLLIKLESIKINKHGYKCHYCHKRFYTMIDWVDHIIIEMKKIKPKSCIICRSRFQNYTNTIQHVIDRCCQKKIPVSICGYCNLRLRTYKARCDHEQTDCLLALMTNPSTISDCEKLFSTDKIKSLQRF